MKQKKSKFLTFLFSLIPGAAEMYMGFFKMGVSLMGLEVLIYFVSAVLNFGVFILIGLLVWFYGFFHAHNLAGMPEAEFQALEDRYLFQFDHLKDAAEPMMKSYRKVIAAVLILVGVGMVGRGLMSLLRFYLPEEIYEIISHITYYIPQMVVGVGIIALGVLLIRGKKRELDEIENQNEREMK